MFDGEVPPVDSGITSAMFCSSAAEKIRSLTSWVANLIITNSVIEIAAQVPFAFIVL